MFSIFIYVTFILFFELKLYIEDWPRRCFSLDTLEVKVLFIYLFIYLLQVFLSSYIRHFSHMTKSRIFKNLNLRKKADRNFRRTFLKNRFRHLKFYSNPPSWLARGRCHMGTIWNTKDWSSHIWEGQPFRYWYVEFNRQRRLKSTKEDIFSLILDSPRNQKFGLFSLRNSLNKKIL